MTAPATSAPRTSSSRRAGGGPRAADSERGKWAADGALIQFHRQRVAFVVRVAKESGASEEWLVLQVLTPHLLCCRNGMWSAQDVGCGGVVCRGSARGCWRM